MIWDEVDVIIIIEIKGTIYGGFSGGSVIKNLPAKQETQVWSLGQEDPQRRKWQPTAVVLPGKSHGQKSLEGYSRRVTRVVDNLATKQQQQLPNKCNVFESSPNHPSCPGPWNNYLPQNWFLVSKRLGASVLQLSSVFDKHSALKHLCGHEKDDGKSSSQVDETGFFSQTTWTYLHKSSAGFMKPWKNFILSEPRPQ